jgi:LysR family hca operon transcriptional activator
LTYDRLSGVDGRADDAGLGSVVGPRTRGVALAMSLVASTRGIALLPAYAQNFLPRSVISRPLEGDVPTIDLVIGYSNANSLRFCNSCFQSQTI